MTEKEKKAIENINELIIIFETNNGKDFEATCLVQKEIASNLKTLLSLVKKLQKENKKLKEENFNLQCIAKQYIELYEKYKKLYERRTNL